MPTLLYIEYCLKPSPQIPFLETKQVETLSETAPKTASDYYYLIGSSSGPSRHKANAKSHSEQIKITKAQKTDDVSDVFPNMTLFF